MSLHVVAHIHARPDSDEDVRDLLVGLIGPTRKEEGCILYNLYVDQDEPTRFTFIEEWTSNEALDAHLASAHIKRTMAQLDGLLACDPEIGRYTVVA